MPGDRRIDLNSDVGEGYGAWPGGPDEALMPLLTSANVACGFHAGDPTILRRTCALAQEFGCVIGAQVSYPDLAGFGRRFIDMDPVHLADEVIYQIGALQALATVAGTRVSYVKPHGALYNTIAHHPVQAQAVIDAIRAVDPTLPVMVLPDSEIQRLADAAGLRTVVEAFADRAYNPDGSLVSRSLPGAVLLDPAAVTEQVLRLAGDRQVRTVDGSLLTVSAESICLHGDTPGAVVLAALVRAALQGAGIPIRSFV